MKIYNYDENGIFVPYLDRRGQLQHSDGAKTARESPAEKGKGIYLVPRFATDIAPNVTLQNNQVAIFNEGTQTWEAKEDYRGAMYWLADEWDFIYPAHQHGDEFGPLPDGASLTRPEIPAQVISDRAVEEINNVKYNVITQKIVDIKKEFLALPLSQRKRNFDLKEKVVSCLLDNDVDLAKDFANDIQHTSFKNKVFQIINR